MKANYRSLFTKWVRFCKEHGIRVSLVSKKLHDFAGMNAEAAKAIGAKIGKNSILIDRSLSPGARCHTLMHEIEEMGLMRAKHLPYWEAHLTSLRDESEKPTEKEIKVMIDKIPIKNPKFTCDICGKHFKDATLVRVPKGIGCKQVCWRCYKTGRVNPIKWATSRVHLEALESLKRYKDDLKAGHTDAAEYWRGQAGAYFTANPMNVGSKRSPVVSPYGLPAYKKDGVWYYQGYSMTGSGKKVWGIVIDPISYRRYEAMYPNPRMYICRKCGKATSHRNRICGDCVWGKYLQKTGVRVVGTRRNPVLTACPETLPTIRILPQSVIRKLHSYRVSGLDMSYTKKEEIYRKYGVIV